MLRRWPAAEIALVLFFAIELTANGVPAMRHDWWWPLDRSGVFDYFIRSVSGWTPVGIGSPNPYPSAFVVAVALAPFMLALPSIASLFVFGLLIAIAVVGSTRAVCAAFQAPLAATASLESLALLNPWTYSQVVAGHTFMLLGWGGFSLVVAAILMSRRNLALVGLAISLCQLQFFVLALLLAIAAAVMRRISFWIPLIGFALVLPVVVGVLSEQTALMSIPFLESWERVQSVDPSQAWFLGGYFAHYTDRAGNVFFISSALLAGTALLGLIQASIRRAIIFAFAMVTPTLLAIGFNGPAGELVSAAFAHLKPVALYRELYDLIGFTLLAYIASAAAASRTRGAVLILLTSAGIALIGWLIAPPSSMWIDSRKLPNVSVSVTGMRFALTPAFMPLSYEGRGAGLDPDAYDRESGTSLNQYVALFPESAALATYQITGDSGPLGRLGVAEIVQRPWFASVPNALGQGAYSPRVRRDVFVANPRPLLATASDLPISSLPTQPGTDAVFFADADNERLTVPVLTNELERGGWRDARTLMASVPTASQGLGGIYGDGHSVAIMREGRFVLAFVEKGLYSGAHPVAGDTHGSYAWVDLRNAQFFACRGLCVIAAFRPTSPNRHLAVIHAPDPIAVSSVRRPVPWLLYASKVHRAHVLLFNERFDAGWVAFSGNRVLRHFRVDLATNGWVLDGSASDLMLVHVPSAAQAALQGLALIILTIALVSASRLQAKYDC